jgi:hypothetical protein
MHDRYSAQTRSRLACCELEKETMRGENLQDLSAGGRLGGYNFITGPAAFWVRTGDAEVAHRASSLLLNAK